MSPLLDLQRRLTEVGRIRLGATEPAKTKQGKDFRRPVKLTTWRLTSRDEDRIRAVAELYGGEPRPWEGREGEWEVITEASALDVVVIPGQALSQWYELWQQPGGKGAVTCVRRCDGEREHLSDGPCLCPPGYDERRELAKDGKACKPTTRLSVILPRARGMGQWRLEAHGWYAAVELAGAVGLLEEATRRGALLPARLRIDQRESVRDGQTLSYPVPVLDVDTTFENVLALGEGSAEGEVPALPSAHTPAPARALPSVSEGLDAVAGKPQERARANAAAPLGPSGPPPPTDAIPVDDDQGDEFISDAQRRLLFAKAGERGMSEDDLRAVVKDVTGDESTAFPRSQMDAVVAGIDAWQPQDDSLFAAPDSVRGAYPE